MKSFLSKKLKYALAFLIISVVVYFMTKQLYCGWDELSNYHYEFSYKMLLLSFLPLTINFLIATVYFQKLLKIFDVSIDLTNTFKVLFISRLGKYIPGGIWPLMGQFYLFDKERVSILKVLMANITLLLLDTISVILVFVPFYVFYLRSLLPIPIAGMITIFCACFIILHPRIFSGIISFITFKLKGESLSINYKYSDLVYLTLLSILDWSIFGLGLYFLINSFYSVKVNLVPVFASTFAVSWVFGVYFFITPNGLGIREGVQSYLLIFFLPAPIAVIFSIMTRFWSTIGDLGGSLVASLIKLSQDNNIKVRMIKSIREHII